MKKNKKTKSNWKYYVIELAVVFVGVTAGFLLNNWRQDQIDLEIEKKYLTSFYNDVLSDETNLDSLIIRNTAKIDTLLNVLKETEVKEIPLNENQAQSIINQIIYIEWFSPSNDTFEDIKNSGNLNLISNYNLKEEISSYYKFVRTVNSVEQYYKDHLDNYALPILYRNYHLFKRKFINKNSFRTLEFTNMYLGLLALMQENNRIYKEAFSKNRELKNILTIELEIEN